MEKRFKKMKNGTRKNGKTNKTELNPSLQSAIAEGGYGMLLDMPLTQGRSGWRGGHTHQLTSNHHVHTRHAMYIASVSFYGSSFQKYRVSVAVDILQVINPWVDIKNSAGLWQPRARPPGSAKGQWLKFGSFSGGSGNETQDTSKNILTLDPETVSCILSNQTQTVVCCGLPDSPSSESFASTGESDSDIFDCEACWISVTGCSRQIHQTRHNRGLKRETNHGKVVGVNTPKLRRIQKRLSRFVVEKLMC